MELTEFGKAIRKSRLDINETLSSMAEAMCVSPAFLSAMETGRKKIPIDFVNKIEQFFSKKGLTIDGLSDYAAVSNESVSLAGISKTHQLMTAKFARSKYSEEELGRIRELLNAINGDKL